ARSPRTRTPTARTTLGGHATGGSLALNEYAEHARAIEQTATVDEIDAALRTRPGRVPVRSRLVVVVGWSLCSVPQISVVTGGCAAVCGSWRCLGGEGGALAGANPTAR